MDSPRTPLISVILPVYNGAEMLGTSICSVLQEDSCSLELIVVDDGSTDEIDKVVKPFLSDPGFTLIRQKHSGLAYALNHGFSESRGLLLTWTSADNNYIKGALPKLADHLLSNPQTGLVFANMELIDERGEKLTNSNYRPQNNHQGLVKLPFSTSALSKCSDNFIGACFMYRRETAFAVGNYNPELPGVEDYDYWTRLSNFTKIEHLPSQNALYQYRLHKKSLTSTLNSKSLVRATHEISRQAIRKAQNISPPLAVDILHSGKDSTLSLQAVKLLFNGLVHSITNYEIDNLKPECTAPGDAVYCCLKNKFESIESSPKPLMVEPSPQACDKTFIHSRHEIFYEDLKPFPLKISKAATRLRDKILPNEVPYETLFFALPPIDLPEVLLLSRDSNFNAIDNPVDSEGKALIFAPDNDKSDIVDSILHTTETLVAFTKHTITLYCTNSEQRRFADLVNLSLSTSPSNFRIIDSSEEWTRCPFNKECLPTEAEGLMSLLYVLSSSDMIVSIKPTLEHVHSLLELRHEVTLAAMAGLNVVCLSNSSLYMPALKANNVFSAIFAEILQAPNLHILNMDLLKHGKKQLSQLEAALHWGKQKLPVKSLNQWIQRQQTNHIARKLLACSIT